MPNWFYPVLALGVGALAALASALALDPVLAFVAGLLLVLAAAVARPGVPAIPEPAPTADPAPDAAPDSGFGRVLVERLPTPLLIVAPSGRVSYANPAALAMLPRLQAGTHFASLIRAPAFVEAVNATLADGSERSIRFTAHQAFERHFEARVALVPPSGPFGPEAQAIVQVEERTEALRAEQLRSDFVANASHELRTPLAAIVGYIETLQHHARDDPEARERFLAIMGREAGRMQRLVDDLMSLSRIEMSEHLRPAEACSLNRIAAESAAALLPLAERHGVTLEIELGPDGATVLGDRDQLAQVFANLIDNAMKYGGPGCTVRVRAAAPSPANPNRHGVVIEDTGAGIPKEHLARLTERFYRVNAGSSRHKGGTGLGLAIVKHVLNRHQGRLEIASTPGKGSAFTVWLPVAGPGAAATPATADRAAAGG